MLSNSGHTQYTYGVERSLLNLANEDSGFAKIILDGLPKDLKDKASEIVNEYDDSKFHLIFTLHRISKIQNAKLKARLFRVMRVLMLPLESLSFDKPSERYKILRLRRLYERVRLLSIVSLDSYYSHHPIRYDVSSALMSLDSLFSDLGGSSSFVTLLEQTSAWLADELYMHPKAVAAQKFYEVRSRKKLQKDYAKRVASKLEYDKFFLNIMNNGFGKPQVGNILPLARMSFEYSRRGPLFGKSLYELNSILENEISPSEKDYVSVMINPYSNMLHIDLLYDKGVSDCKSIGEMCSRTMIWLDRSIEAQVKNRLRRFPSNLLRNKEYEAQLRRRNTLDIVSNSYKPMKSIYNGIIKFLLPDDLTGCFTEIMPSTLDGSIGIKMTLHDGSVHDTLLSEIDVIISNKYLNLEKDRIHELETLKAYISKSKAKVIIANLDKYLIRNSNGNDEDDWDGAVLEINESSVSFSVLEAKNLKNKSSRANQAFNQLKDTQLMIKKKHPTLSGRRYRIKNFGAYVKFHMS